jgi:hypothetical protein
MFEFLALGFWGFWVLTVVSAVIMSELLDNNYPGSATILAIVTVAVLAFFGGVNPLNWIQQHPGESVIAVVGYFVVGVAWSLVKWYFFLLNLRRCLVEIRNKHPDLTRQDVIEQQHCWALQGEWPPQVSKNKSRVIGWMALWPASMLWTMINDPVRRICEGIYNLAGSLFQIISNRVFRDFK